MGEPEKCQWHFTVRRIDRTGQITNSPGSKIQARASKILGPISGHLMAQIIPMIRQCCTSLWSWVGRWHPSVALQQYVHSKDSLPTTEPTLDEPDCLCPLTLTFLLQLGETLGSTFEESVYSTSSSLKLYSEAFNVGLLSSCHGITNHVTNTLRISFADGRNKIT